MKRLYIAIAAAATLATGCNKFDDDINRNPNLPSQAAPAQLLTGAMQSLPDLSSSPQGEFLAQYLAETQYVGASQYPDGGTSFYGWYQGPLMNIEYVLTAADLAVQPSVNQIAVAKILKAYYFWNITDRWGDVPYSEALKGSADFTPAYDTQESIYDALFTLLDEANASIVTTQAITGDIVYNGDMAQWKRLANTIHMLMALRLSERDATKGQTEFNKALTNGIMTSNTHNFTYRHLAEAANQNYWFGQVVTQNREWWALTKTLVEYMKPLSDPRLAVYGKPNNAAQYEGLEFGTTVGIPNTTTVSLLGTAIYAQAAPVPLVTYAQALFAKAEAAKRGWITGGDAEALLNYNLAIEQSFRQWTGGTTGLAAYMSNPEVSYNPARAIEQISNQRYVHLFMHGYEAWSEWRRTGFPNTMISPLGRAVPTRLGYPDNEAFNNKTNYEAAISRQFGGTNGLYGKVWWDQ